MTIKSSSPSKPSPFGPAFRRVTALLGLLACAWAPLPVTAAATADDPYLGLDAPSVREGDGGTTTLTFTARLTDAMGRAMASEKTITARYEVLSEGGDTATAGTDYKATSGTLTFAPGERIKTIGVSVVGDTDVEGDETLSVKWTAWENVWLVSYTHTGTIVNDDTAPLIPATVTIADASVGEGDALSFKMTLDNAVPGGFTVTPAFTDGTATGGTDYAAGTAPIAFAGTAGETQTLTVATTEDEEVEDDETFTVNLTVSGTAHPVTATDTATGTITNDDTAPVVPATVTIADASAGEGDALTFTVTLDNAVDGGLTVTPAFTDGTATGGTDYTANTAPRRLRGHGRRDADVHRDDHRRRGGGRRRDLHRRPSPSQVPRTPSPPATPPPAPSPTTTRHPSSPPP